MNEVVNYKDYDEANIDYTKAIMIGYNKNRKTLTVLFPGYRLRFESIEYQEYRDCIYQMNYGYQAWLDMVHKRKADRNAYGE